MIVNSERMCVSHPQQLTIAQIAIEAFDFYVRPGATDMRKSATSLAYLVQHEMHLQPFTKAVFLFCGHNKKTIKAIVWDRNGWIQVIKRLECTQGFRWPQSSDDPPKIRIEGLVGLLQGADVWRHVPTFEARLVS